MCLLLSKAVPCTHTTRHKGVQESIAVSKGLVQSEWSPQAFTMSLSLLKYMIREIAQPVDNLIDLR
jgi:hypothetical protein